MKTGWMLAVTGAAVTAACVTINVYFPAAAAEKAADRIIDDVWGDAAAPAPPTAKPGTPQSAVEPPLQRLLIAGLDLLIPRAQAQQQPNLDLSSPEITRIKTQMETRFAELKPQLDSGTVGLAADGSVAIREPGAVPLASRNMLRALVANENADRAALYREIAVANQHPEWEAQIRAVFAQRWVAKAQAGWWYQDSGGWKQK